MSMPCVSLCPRLCLFVSVYKEDMANTKHIRIPPKLQEAIDKLKPERLSEHTVILALLEVGVSAAQGEFHRLTNKVMGTRIKTAPWVPSSDKDKEAMRLLGIESKED